MKQNNMYPYGKGGDVVSIVGGGVLLYLLHHLHLLHSYQTLETAPKAVSTSERLMSLLIIGLSCPKRFDGFE